jgi:ribonuclease D
VNNLFDSGIAAAFVGSARLGLQSVVLEQLGIELPKPLELQRSDWTLRPLSPEALDYAANDVLHLSRVRETLASQLKALSRLEWAKEEFTRLENVRHAPADRESAFLAVKGSQGLDGRGLAILRSLFQFREREASRLDRSRFRVMPDSALVQVASEPTADLSAVKGLGRYGRSPACEGLRDAIDRGLAAPRVTRPKPIQNEDPLEPAEREKVMLNLRALKTWRRRLGQELGMDPSLLWPTVSLERFARRPDDLDSEFLSSEVRSWQRREFGPGLRRALATLNYPDRETYQGRLGPE